MGAHVEKGKGRIVNLQRCKKDIKSGKEVKKLHLDLECRSLLLCLLRRFFKSWQCPIRLNAIAFGVRRETL